MSEERPEAAPESGGGAPANDAPAAPAPAPAAPAPAPAADRVGRQALVLLAAFVVVCAGLKAAASLVVPLLLAVLLATASWPIVQWLRRLRLPRALAIALALALELLALVAFGVLLMHAAQDFYAKLPGYTKRLRSGLAEATEWLAGKGVEVSGEAVAELGDPGAVMGTLKWLLQSLTDLLGQLFLVVVLVAFMLFEASGLAEKAGRVLGGAGPLARAEETLGEVKKYLGVKTGLCLATGVLVGLWTWLMGLDLPLLWGLLAFVLNYIPSIGSMIAAIPAVLLAFVLGGPGMAFGTAVGYVGINVAIGTIAEPRLMGRAMGISPLVVIGSMLFWGWLLGPVGAVLSAPLTMVLKIVLSNAPDLEWVAVLLGPSAEARRDASP